MLWAGFCHWSRSVATVESYEGKWMVEGVFGSWPPSDAQKHSQTTTHRRTWSLVTIPQDWLSDIAGKLSHVFSTSFWDCYKAYRQRRQELESTAWKSGQQRLFGFVKSAELQWPGMQIPLFFRLFWTAIPFLNSRILMLDTSISKSRPVCNLWSLIESVWHLQRQKGHVGWRHTYKHDFLLFWRQEAAQECSILT